MNQSNSKKNLIAFWIIFLINPLLSVLMMLRERNFVSRGKNILWLYTGFIAAAMMVRPGSDLERYVEQFHLFGASFDVLIGSLSSLYTQGATTSAARMDIYLDVVMFFVKLIGDYSMLFVVVLGLIFGFFYSRYLALIINQVDGMRWNFFSYLFLLIILFSINPFMGIGQRYFTAAVVLMYAGFLYIFDNKIMYIILMLGSVLIHVGILPLVFMFLIMGFVKRRGNIVFVVFLASFFISTIDFSAYGELFASQGAQGIENKLDSYTSENAADNYQTRFREGAWHLAWAPRFFKFSASFLIVLWYFFNKTNRNVIPTYVFNTAFFPIIFWNLMASFPMIYRYEPVFVVMVSVSLFWVFKYFEFFKFKRVAYLCVPFLVLFALVKMKILLGALPYYIAFSNPILIAFLETDISLDSVLFGK